MFCPFAAVAVKIDMVQTPYIEKRLHPKFRPYVVARRLWSQERQGCVLCVCVSEDNSRHFWCDFFLRVDSKGRQNRAPIAYCICSPQCRRSMYVC